MTKFNAQIWYTVSRYHRVEIEAETQDEAESEAWAIALDANVDDWVTCEDSSFEIDVREAKQ